MDHTPYLRRVNYYETDQMAIVHHSNYIRYMEEARLDFMGKNGLNYATMEEAGVIIPVTEVSCKYHTSARFDDLLEIYPRLTSFNGVRFSLSYELRFADGSPCATGASSHCFLDGNHRPISLKRKYPEFYQAFQSVVESEQK